MVLKVNELGTFTSFSLLSNGKSQRRQITSAIPPAANLNLTFESLFQDPIKLLIPENHQLATADNISLSSLADERLILTEEHCPYRNILEKALLPRGINPFSGIEIVSLEALKQMVKYGWRVRLECRRDRRHERR